SGRAGATRYLASGSSAAPGGRPPPLRGDRVAGRDAAAPVAPPRERGGGRSTSRPHAQAPQAANMRAPRPPLLRAANAGELLASRSERKRLPGGPGAILRFTS